MQAITDSRKIVIVTLIFPDVVPQLKYASVSFQTQNLSVALLHFCCIVQFSRYILLITFAIRFEDPTSVRSSNPTTNVVWWARVGSNHRPCDYQSHALAS